MVDKGAIAAAASGRKESASSSAHGIVQNAKFIVDQCTLRSTSHAAATRGVRSRQVSRQIESSVNQLSDDVAWTKQQK